MNNGWITIHRVLTKWEWYKKSEMVHLFLHLLLLANHDENQWQGITIKRGQLVTGLNSLSNETGISTQTLRTCLKRLELTSEITSKVTNKFRIISITKYNDYQNSKEKLTSKLTSKLTNNQQSTNNQLTTNNNINKVNNIINIIDSSNSPSKIANKFFNSLEEQERIMKELILKGYNEKVVKQELFKFISYWTEPNKSGSKQRWQMEVTFEISRRLATWFSRINTFNDKSIKTLNL